MAFLIDKQRKRDSGLFAEELGVVPVAQSNCRDAGSSAPEFCLVFAQLRDVLAAEETGPDTSPSIARNKRSAVLLHYLVELAAELEFQVFNIVVAGVKVPELFQLGLKCPQ